MDGVLLPVATFPASLAGNVVARLKVLAGLLTYHTDRPQEGRIRLPQDDVEMRVCTYPTLHGERAVVRLFGGSKTLPTSRRSRPARRRAADAAIPVDGRPRRDPRLRPGRQRQDDHDLRLSAGNRPRSEGVRSLMTIEDPVEVSVGGVAQSQVHPTVGLDLAAGLRFLMRQDPEVIMVGEIRDRPTAEAALQASLTGHLLLSTFHAGSAAETVGRLLDMGIEPYVLRSGILAILHQRLLRRLCTCAEPSDKPEARLGLEVERAKVPRGCDKCGGTGYRGRFLLVEMLMLSAHRFGPRRADALRYGHDRAVGR